MNWSDMYRKKIEKAGGLEKFLEKKKKRSAGALIQRVKSELKPGARILEVGTGTGAVGALLIKEGFDTAGIDCDSGILSIAKQMFGLYDKSENVFLLDILDVPRFFGKNSFDCVLSHGVLEHYLDEEIIKFLNAQLEVAPLVIFDVPTNLMSSKYRAKGFGDERYLSTSRWKKIISKNFNLKKIYGFGFKEIGLPKFTEILLKNNKIASLLSGFCGINEFWITR
jgi:hypothetical protein